MQRGPFLDRESILDEVEIRARLDKPQNKVPNKLEVTVDLMPNFNNS